MKNYLIYSLKKAIWPFSILLVVGMLLIIFPELGIESYYQTPTIYGDYYWQSSAPIGTLLIFIGTLTFVMPVLQLSFAKESRQVDQYYSAPISRKHLLLVQYLIGLIQIVLYTVIFTLLLIAVIATKPHAFDMGYFFLMIPFLLVAAFSLYSLNCFLFHQANAVYDGVIFMLMYIPILTFAYASIYSLIPPVSTRPNGFTVAQFLIIASRFGEVLLLPVRENGSAIFGSHKILILGWEEIVDFVSFFVFGVAGLLGLVLYAPHEKAERAGQISDSWFGYKVINPLLIFLVTSQLYIFPLVQLFFPIAIGIVLTILYRRTFKIKWQYWFVPAVAYLGGIGFAFLRTALQSYYDTLR